jgi:hypothetical protein
VMTWPAVAAQQAGFYERVLCRPTPASPRLPTSANIRAATEEWGPPARLSDGTERPFALPLLRKPGLHARALGAALDALTELRGPSG